MAQATTKHVKETAPSRLKVVRACIFVSGLTPELSHGACDIRHPETSQVIAGAATRWLQRLVRPAFRFVSTIQRTNQHANAPWRAQPSASDDLPVIISRIPTA